MDGLSFAVRTKWLGQPATNQGVVPASAGRLVRGEGGTYINRAEIQPGIVQTGVGAAIVALFKDQAWRAGQVTAAGVFTDDTADAQDSDTNDFALETTTVNDGCLIGALEPFSALSIDVTTAGSGTTPTHVIEYWNGTAWTAIAATGLLVDIARSTDWLAGEQLVMFIPPADWVVGGSGTGVPQNLFNVRIRRTNATQATAALARRIYVGRVIISAVGLGADASYERAFPNPIFLSPSRYAALGAAFGGAADEGNLVFLELSDGTPF